MAQAVKVAEPGEIAPGDKKLLDLDGRPLALFRIEDHYYAIDDVCTHDGGPLADGDFRGCLIECPRHGGEFDVRTGAAVRFPAVDPVPTLPVEIRDDGVYILVDA